ncbi:MAG: DnaA/Hda family protein [Nitratireductor sp.]
MPKNNNDQMALSLPVEESIAREDLLQSDANKLAVELIDNWPDWPSHVVVLAGPIGSGKTHMARIWAETSNATIIEMQDLPNLAPTLGDDQNIVVENVTAKNMNEDALFHCFNRAKANGSYILITCREFPSAWQLKLPDLSSRMRTAHIVELEEPDDQLLAGILMKLFADRQLQVEMNLIDYMVTRMERSLGAANEIVRWMDKEALGRGKKINRSLASEALVHFGMIESN